MEKHQRNYGANGKIMNYLQQTYLYPTSFDTFLYASQLLQAEAIRYGVEHFRRNRGRCMGAIYWQLNDCWPVISWSSIDYTGRWKALHYYAKRFFAPLMISCQEEGMMSQKADMNREHFEFEKSIWLCVANESRKDENLKVHWSVRNAGAEILKEETREVFVPALSSVWLDKQLLPNIDIFNEYVSYSLYSDDNVVSEGTVIFSYPKYFKYNDPKLSYSVLGNEVIINAQAYAKSVEIQNDEEDLVLSDNYFDMNGGEKRVTVLRGDVSNLRLRSVFDIR
jgi:beta-mannosidase